MSLNSKSQIQLANQKRLTKQLPSTEQNQQHDQKEHHRHHQDKHRQNKRQKQQLQKDQQPQQLQLYQQQQQHQKSQQSSLNNQRQQQPHRVAGYGNTNASSMSTVFVLSTSTASSPPSSVTPLSAINSSMDTKRRFSMDRKSRLTHSWLVAAALLGVLSLMLLSIGHTHQLQHHQQLSHGGPSPSTASLIQGAASLSSGSSASPASASSKGIFKRSFAGLGCLGVYDKAKFARLDHVCEECYTLYREPDIHIACRADCFRNQVFGRCVDALLLTHEQKKFDEMVEELYGK